ncbi:pyridoxal phosphate-dependent aminotransferase [Virgibacillus oceani]
MSLQLSDAAKNYPASVIRKMFELANDYEGVIKLTVGEPDFETPDHIKEEAKIAIDQGHTKYTSNAGIDELRGVITERYSENLKSKISKDQVMVTFGGMEAILLALYATVNPGDELLIADPGYPNYMGQIHMLGAKAVPVPVFEENKFKLQAKDVENAITSNTKVLILNSPSNPLGAVLDEREIRELAKIVQKYNLYVISDEVYDKIIYDGKPHFSIAEIPEVRDQVLVINSLSKTYAMTGWRVGFVIGNEKVISIMPKLQEGIASCVPGFIQKAAIEAITGPQTIIENMVKDYSWKRQLVYDGLNDVPGISCMKTEGAFYAFANIKSFSKSSEDFAIELLENAGVATVPGSAFGEMGEGFLRLSFASGKEELEEAISRIKSYIVKNY